MGYIYKITNKEDGKIYIGQTTQILEDRWRQHKKIGSNCRYLKRAFNKYGIHNFEFKLICICFDEDLDKYEIQYMEKYSSMVPNGYNLRKGGNSGKHHEETKKKISDSLKGRTDIFRAKTTNRLGMSHTEETKKKISQALKSRTDIIRHSHQLGKPHTEETKKKISNSLKGRTDIRHNYHLGISHTEETKKKISDALKGRTDIIRYCYYENKNINQYDLNNNFIKSFNNIISASRYNNISRNGISKCCSNQQKTAGGFIWKMESI